MELLKKNVKWERETAVKEIDENLKWLNPFIFITIDPEDMSSVSMHTNIQTTYFILV